MRDGIPPEKFDDNLKLEPEDWMMSAKHLLGVEVRKFGENIFSQDAFLASDVVDQAALVSDCSRSDKLPKRVNESVGGPQA